MAAIVGAGCGAFGVGFAWTRRGRFHDFPAWAWWSAVVLCAIAGAAAGFALGSRLLGPQASRREFEERLRKRRGNRP